MIDTTLDSIYYTLFSKNGLLFKTRLTTSLILVFLGL